MLRKRKTLNLALQGGGALTWGVLDRLLEEPCLRIEAISGTSASAMNAAALASGWVKGGRAGARETFRHQSAAKDHLGVDRLRSAAGFRLPADA
jgi:predicted acylesterase/phospholipase RssA